MIGHFPPISTYTVVQLKAHLEKMTYIITGPMILRLPVESLMNVFYDFLQMSLQPYYSLGRNWRKMTYIITNPMYIITDPMILRLPAEKLMHVFYDEYLKNTNRKIQKMLQHAIGM